MTDDLISRQAVLDALMVAVDDVGVLDAEDIETVFALLPSAQPDFDITVKIDKAYDDGYEAGYLQGRHEWGDLDE